MNKIIGGKTMNEYKEYIFFGMTAIILVLVIFQSFQIRSMKETSNSVEKPNGALDMSSWTEDEKMMYEHHGTLPAKLQSGNNQPSSTGMVGGC
ncbi:hypothetical protein J4230_03530 [Candidatus Woesearchaeota archaeon]|nr:hypothetical protein [Candidatus Woesearchaeota archaeon]